MEMTAKEISKLINGEILGDPKTIVNAPANIDCAGKGDITFLGNAKYEPHIYTSKASIVIVPKSFSLLQEVSATLIKVDNVYASVGILLKQFEHFKGPQQGISSMAFIHKNTKLDGDITIGAYSVINEGAAVGSGAIIFDQVYLGHNVKIGKNTLIYPGVKIYEGTIVGNNCIIHSNAVIGSDGFGFSRISDGSYAKIPQIGNVIIEDDVEIGACTVIDRATMDNTIIKKGVKLDNLIQVAHNVVVGDNTVIAAQTGISGSTTLGKDCMIGGQTGFTGHIKVADGTMVQAQSGVAGNVNQERSKLYGSPAIDYQQYLKAFAYFKKLPEIVQSIRELEQRVDHLNRIQKIN